MRSFFPQKIGLLPSQIGDGSNKLPCWQISGPILWPPGLQRAKQAVGRQNSLSCAAKNTVNFYLKRVSIWGNLDKEK
jgi:hypothetical protein